MTYKIFVDGQAGTTGLEIHQRLANRSDLEIIEIDPAQRKDTSARQALINESDITFLCLPDAASKESVSLCTSDSTRFIDASTAYRTADDWTYGIAELSPIHRQAIAATKRLSNPGCHATGFIALVYPLIQAGAVNRDYPFTCYSLTGYSGGGRQMIEDYQKIGYDQEGFNAPRHYALGLGHKHIPEMTKRTGISYEPIFAPVLGNYYRGMFVTVPLHSRLLPQKMSAANIQSLLAEHYANEYFVTVRDFGDTQALDAGQVDPTKLNNSNHLEVLVFGHQDQILLGARFDNLGKGASGAAIQNMNIMLGIEETVGL